jgi:NAD(P)-dependent dehydrogenase (short-subunit alcohol dehydrogenase family)
MVDEDESVDLSFGLKGKVTVVTGGAAGIGAAIARAFVAKGARVALVDRDIDTARAHARNLGENVRAFQCDVADPSSAENAVRSVLTEFGHMDVLANCAGMVVLAPAEDLTSQMWDTTLAVNLTGTFLMSQQVGRAMLEAGGGKIINIASQAASIGLDQHAAYCASKAGVRGPAPGGRGASRWVLPDGQRGLSAAAPGARRPRAEGGHVLGVDVPAAGDELVDDRGKVHRGGVDRAVGDQLVEPARPNLIPGIAQSRISFSLSLSRPTGGPKAGRGPWALIHQRP